VDETIAALRAGETNYPPSDGVAELRKAFSAFYGDWLGLEYGVESVLVTSGSRPGLYAAYRALVDAGDTVVYPVPSWNNNHYVHLVDAKGHPIVTRAEDAFLPTRAALEDAVRGARLLVLNSPLNPTGTAFTADALAGICDLVLKENARRGAGERPLYLLYDSVYWMLTFGDTTHVNPVSLRPAMRDYTVFVDGISKSFAATGVRVGWIVGPADVMSRMSSLIGHVGAGAPRAEQLATSKLLADRSAIQAYHATMKRDVIDRLEAIHTGLQALRDRGFPVEVVRPMGAIYLSARFDLMGRTVKGVAVKTNEDIRRLLLEHAGLAIVPFQAFGLKEESGWFRLSVGAVSMKDIEQAFPRLRALLA